MLPERGTAQVSNALLKRTFDIVVAASEQRRFVN
jgi:hypothetical protein